MRAGEQIISFLKDRGLYGDYFSYEQYQELKKATEWVQVNQILKKSRLKYLHPHSTIEWFRKDYEMAKKEKVSYLTIRVLSEWGQISFFILPACVVWDIMNYRKLLNLKKERALLAHT